VLNSRRLITVLPQPKWHRIKADGLFERAQYRPDTVSRCGR
jgi:hypothetical protein